MLFRSGRGDRFAADANEAQAGEALIPLSRKVCQVPENGGSRVENGDLVALYPVRETIDAACFDTVEACGCAIQQCAEERRLPGDRVERSNDCDAICRSNARVTREIPDLILDGAMGVQHRLGFAGRTGCEDDLSRRGRKWEPGQLRID